MRPLNSEYRNLTLNETIPLPLELGIETCHLIHDMQMLSLSYIPNSFFFIFFLSQVSLSCPGKSSTCSLQPSKKQRPQDFITRHRILYFYFFIYFVWYVYVCAYHDMCGVQRETLRSQFSPFTIQGPGVKLHSGLAASVFTCWVIPPANYTFEELDHILFSSCY